MPAQLGSNQITGISTAVSGSDAAYKDYVDNNGPIPSIINNENEFLFTDGSAVSWEPIHATQEYTTAGSYTFPIPLQAKELLIEATGAGGGGASGNTDGSGYESASIWTIQQQVSNSISSGNFNSMTFGNNLYVVCGSSGVIVTSTNIYSTWVKRTSGLGSLTINSITYGNNFYVIAANTGNIRA